MALSAASRANVSRQGINPPGAGGDPLVYPDTTRADLAAWTPPPPRSPVALPPAPGAPRRFSPSRRIPAGQTRAPLGLAASVLVLIRSEPRIMKRRGGAVGSGC